MTWIKPSFLWMMYRSGWATKADQERILAIRMTRNDFEETLSLASLSHYDPLVYGSRDEWRERRRLSPVRIQWDPERDVDLSPLPWRSLQVGLSGPAVERYLNDWVTEIRDITNDARVLRDRVNNDPSLLPDERPYPLNKDSARVIGASN
jgi:hypothetical protein